MKNYEMFERIFGFHPEEYSIVPCPTAGERCRYTSSVNPKECCCSDWWQEEYKGYFHHHNGLKQEPAIQIHAAWCKTVYGGLAFGNTIWTCSNCGESFETEELDWKFCPQCGAKMDREAAGDNR